MFRIFWTFSVVLLLLRAHADEIQQPCENDNGGCDHFCHTKEGNVECSCASGYNLINGKSCHSADPFKCGVVHPIQTQMNPHAGNSDTRSTNSPLSTGAADAAEESVGDTSANNEKYCLPGECPWQALLVDKDGKGFCGGTILNENFILTAAQCLNQSESLTVVLGEFNTSKEESREVRHEVGLYVAHKLFNPVNFQHDIALIKLKTPIKFTKYILPACLPDRDFAERVLMRQKDGMISGFGAIEEGGPDSSVLRKLVIPYVNRATCIESSEYRISRFMFCAGFDHQRKDACDGDGGGPHVTKYKDTWFVTGVISWGEGCARKGKYGVYTQVSKYISWVNGAMDHFMST